jgi:hypothetical protein
MFLVTVAVDEMAVTIGEPMAVVPARDAAVKAVLVTGSAIGVRAVVAAASPQKTGPSVASEMSVKCGETAAMIMPLLLVKGS